ncbi:MAG: hypothetical protein KAH22_08165 [Thiotrichaceae bacterium]|nr:hypothetical protein [Thiotrichaceae bacterium]
MKTRIRKITVKNKVYSWLADEVLFPECILKVWMECDKNKPFIHMQFSNIESVITPSIVANVIEYVVKLSDSTEGVESPVALQFRDQKFFRV